MICGMRSSSATAAYDEGHLSVDFLLHTFGCILHTGGKSTQRNSAGTGKIKIFRKLYAFTNEIVSISVTKVRSR